MAMTRTTRLDLTDAEPLQEDDSARGGADVMHFDDARVAANAKLKAAADAAAATPAAE
jgi:hypothetical protein